MGSGNMEQHGAAEEGLMVVRTPPPPVTRSTSSRGAALCDAGPAIASCAPPASAPLPRRLTLHCMTCQVDAPSGRRPPARRTSSSSASNRVAALTVVLAAALFCAKVAGPRQQASHAPSLSALELAVRELLTASTGKEHADAVKAAKSSAAREAAQTAVAGKHGSQIKKVQKLDEEAPAEEAPAEEAPAEEAPAEEAPVAPAAPAGEGADNGEMEGSAKGDLEPGWDKSAWSSGDLASWIITGPLITMCFSFFMFYTYGVPAGALTAIICALIDVATFYYNW
jgi:hypothetical protein